MMWRRTAPLLIISVLAVSLVSNGEIHRAKSSPYKSGRRASNAGEQLVDVAADSEMLNHENAAAAALHLGSGDKFGTYDVWIYSIVGAILVGLSGILPLLILPIEVGPSLKHGGKCF